MGLTREPLVAPTGPRPVPAVTDTPEARDELECPLCGYSLKGLGSAPAAAGAPATGEGPEAGEAPGEAPAAPAWTRCPECGYVVYWRMLLYARQNRHTWLFEHHYVWSYFVTLLAGLRPRRFWSGLNAGHELRRGRLVLYWVITSALVVFSCVEGRWFIELARAGIENHQSGAPIFSGPRPRLLEFFQSSDLEFEVSLVGVVWPGLSLLTLLIFRASMRRARLRTGHVLRCVVYSGDVFVWVGVLALLLHGVHWLFTPDVSEEAEAVRLKLAAAGAATLIVVATYRLAVAYRDYLHFDHPWATAVASQVVAVLLLVAAFTAMSRQFYRFFL